MTESVISKENIELRFGNFKYDKIIPFSHSQRDYTVAILNGKSGLIDINGRELTEFIYDDMSNEIEDESYYEVGWIHFEHPYDKLCRMRLNGKWGLLDNNGNIVVDFKFANPVQEWGENFIIGKSEKEAYKEFVIDKNGNIHSELCFDGIIPCSEFAIVIQNKKYGIIDKNYKIIVDYKYDYLYAGYTDKFLTAKIGKKWGIIDLKENIILDFIYQDIEIENYNKKCVFKAKYNNKYALFNIKGKRIA